MIYWRKDKTLYLRLLLISIFYSNLSTLSFGDSLDYTGQSLKLLFSVFSFWFINLIFSLWFLNLIFSLWFLYLVFISGFYIWSTLWISWLDWCILELIVNQCISLTLVIRSLGHVEMNFEIQIGLEGKLVRGDARGYFFSRE